MAQMARRTRVFTRRMLRRPVVRRGLLLLLIYSALSLFLLISLWPEAVQLEVGQASIKYIGAPRTVEDRHTTNRLREQAAQTVPDIYEQDPNVYIESSRLVTETFNSFITIGSGDEPMSEKIQLLQETLSLVLPDPVLQTGVRLEPETARQLSDILSGLLEEAYGRGIKAEGLTTALDQLYNRIDEHNIPNSHKVLLRQIGSRVLQPNMFFNAATTERLRQEAAARVAPVLVQKGQKVIGQGEIATEREIMLLEDLGLLRRGVDWPLLFGALTFAGIALLPTFLYLLLHKNKVIDNTRMMLLLALILVVTATVSKVTSGLSGYLMPVAMAAILVTVLIEPWLAMMSGISLALLTGAAAGFDAAFIGLGLVGSAVGVFSVSRMHQRWRFDLVRAGAFVAAAQAMVALAFGLLLGTTATALFTDVFSAASNGIVSAILAMGFMRYLEDSFGITSTVKLLELANPNHPLLKRLMIEAPGTYNHSIIVANLAEAAAEAVGADGLLARVGAYFHDVGKLKRPYFFIENQFMMDNPHDKYPPSLSTLVITSHVKDGAEMAREHKLPQVIVDIIQQHHGTALMTFFYNKAREAGDVLEQDFRYAGPKPQTKEAAIVSLADHVEAAVRSLSHPNPSRIENLVRKIIKDRLNEGHLDESDLTLKELDKVGDALVHILSGIFHKRIEYPERLKEGERKAEDNDTDQQ